MLKTKNDIKRNNNCCSVETSNPYDNHKKNKK